MSEEMLSQPSHEKLVLLVVFLQQGVSQHYEPGGQKQSPSLLHPFWITLFSLLRYVLRRVCVILHTTAVEADFFPVRIAEQFASGYCEVFTRKFPHSLSWCYTFWL